ncbi:related to GAL11 DNA-directed RNA polymerase II holoenzyme and Kornberg`s mediator (SRB) subcomplex subunit [Phialocephala subalpina]|uniref:Related to GAL11 DNA-directed RNA polymerase II holoenzyme and Kornberg`s mediator (SRB) subcomplex subunit n=1 Tax=Phialocephala subalpina TaxID=576137 RepID=A0A1L7XXM9_9HELO|nr:related to GAL11 DNA-directed RNA polymerase II holoenzyme and Kornberg`s mediator (SRB) subcomplex subunit [Phialocephala subalpina]
MVYDWENKEEICYRMYIEEKKSLEEIMDYMKEHHKFTPSKRAFQTQFKRWDFPSKQNPAHKNAALVQRVKELWDCNTSQREMLRTLNDEGFDIKERELMRVRAKNRWLLRVPNGMKTKKRDSDQDVINQLQQALYPDGQMADAEAEEEPVEEMTMPDPPARSTRGDSPPLSPEVMRKRQERLAKLQAESAERWATRKRRRRTRGWAGLPADPPGPPRFPSETTIDESKAFLSLDNRLYRDIRARFQRICEEADIIKKTIAGPERWEAAKDRLIQESQHLQTVFWGNEDNQEAKKLALDVVCSDVTKRMRTLERRMTIAEAKNSLGVNPEESRQLRNAFYQVLKADHFTSKLEAGEDHWKELKAQWINGSQLLQNILAPGDSDPQHQEKVKAMEVLCRDVMKRLRDDQTKRDPTRKKKFDSNYTAPEPDMDNPFGAEEEPENTFQSEPDSSLMRAAALAQAQTQMPQMQNQMVQDQPRAPSRSQSGMGRPQSQQQQRPPPPMQPHGGMLDHNNMQIDPSLLLAAANDPSLMGRGMQDQFSNPQYTDQQYAAQAAQAAFPPSPSSFAVYFRLHPASDVQSNARLWVSTLSSITVDELRQLAVLKFPGTLVFRIEGVIKQPNGHEMTLPIDQDEELEAYLAAIQGVKPIFSVQLVMPWKNGPQM